MQADYMVLADAVTASEGKLYIHGGGWDNVLTAVWPATLTASVGILLRVPWGETNEEHTIELDIVDADGKSILPPPGPLRGAVNAGRPPQLEPGTDQVTPLAIVLNGTKIEKAGRYVVEFSIDGQEKARAPFRVSQMMATQIVNPQSGQSPAA